MNNFIYRKEVSIIADIDAGKRVYEIRINSYLFGLKTDSTYIGLVTEHEASLLAGILDKTDVKLKIVL